MEIKPKVTIHYIASELNITASTVSRALNNSPRISKATKNAVLKLAKQLNYQPNHLAAALRNGKSQIIGVIVPTVDRSFFASVVRGIEEIANQLNYKIIICQSHDNYETEVQIVDTLFSAQVDGIIASIAKHTKTYDHFEKAQMKGIPLVLFDRTTPDLEVNQVMIDNHLGAYQVVEHLIQQNCKRIAHFTNNVKINIFEERLRGYKDALKDHGIAVDESLIVESNLQLEDGRKCMEELLTLDKLPDGIFSASDHAILGAMQVLRERKIKIPEQIALAGFNNERFTDFSDPPITSVDQLSVEMGNITAKMFFEQLNSKNKEIRKVKKRLTPKLIIRDSSRRMGNGVVENLAEMKVCR